MKNKKGLGIGLITIMIIVCIVLVIMMFVGGKKESYYGITKDSTTIDKMINTKNEKIEKNVELPKDANVSVKKEDFVMLFKDEKTGKITKVKKVNHDDVPHGLMSKIHDMGNMKHGM